jgi:hypothetical protein
MAKSTENTMTKSTENTMAKSTENTMAKSTENTMAKRNRKKITTIYKALSRKLMTEQHEPH